MGIEVGARGSALMRIPSSPNARKQSLIDQDAEAVPVLTNPESSTRFRGYQLQL
jgi:hypothetical protein